MFSQGTTALHVTWERECGQEAGRRGEDEVICWR